MRESINPEDVVIMLVNLTDSDHLENAKKIIADAGLETMSYYDINGEITKHYNVIGVPATFYINPQGIIKNIVYGADTSAGILEKINE